MAIRLPLAVVILVATVFAGPALAEEPGDSGEPTAVSPA